MYLITYRKSFCSLCGAQSVFVINLADKHRIFIFDMGPVCSLHLEGFFKDLCETRGHNFVFGFDLGSIPDEYMDFVESLKIHIKN